MIKHCTHSLSVVFLFFLFSCATNPPTQSQSPNEKQKGAHVFRIKDTTNLQAIRQNNIEWITLVPWAFQKDFDSSELRHHRGDSAAVISVNARYVERIKSRKAAGFKVFVKPHVWIHEATEGKWRSDIFPLDDEGMETWKAGYRDFILRYAKIAEQANAEQFCIGTELTRMSLEQPVFWKNLIEEVRTIYAGKITYAANWYEEFENITFWKELDFIGIQAYFPLTENKNPTVEEISKGWNQYFPIMKSIHEKFSRKILFTEMGYKSTAGSAVKPWEWVEDGSDSKYELSLETQANCYQAFFDTVWDKEWFAGVHIWQIRGNHDGKHDGYGNMDFTPQGKPAMKVIAKGFE